MRTDASSKAMPAKMLNTSSRKRWRVERGRHQLFERAHTVERLIASGAPQNPAQRLSILRAAAPCAHGDRHDRRTAQQRSRHLAQRGIDLIRQTRRSSPAKPQCRTWPTTPTIRSGTGTAAVVPQIAFHRIVSRSNACRASMSSITTTPSLPSRSVIVEEASAARWNAHHVQVVGRHGGGERASALITGGVSAVVQ